MEFENNMEANGNGNGNGKRGLPKLRELLRRQRQESEIAQLCEDVDYRNSPSLTDSPDLDFLYYDADKQSSEVAELYSYTEEPEFAINRKCFEEILQKQGLSDTAYNIGFDKWSLMTETQRKTFLQHILNLLEVSQQEQRMKIVRSVLYLVQGVFGECEEEVQQRQMSRHNVFLLYEMGVFIVFVELLNMEADNSTAASFALRKPAVSLADSTDLRVILSVLYTMVEVMRTDEEIDSDYMNQLRNMFKYEIGQPVCGDETLAVLLFGMVTKFCSGNAPHFPMKKVLLLLWKTILVSLGGMNELRELKARLRDEAGLPAVKEDTIEVTRTMRAASPPASAADLIEQQQLRRNNRPLRKQGLTKQTSLDDPSMDDDDRTDDELREIEENQRSCEEDLPPPPLPCPRTPVSKGLPWTPKVRLKDIEAFLDNTRLKFVGFNIPNDKTSLAGLPEPIHEGVKVLNEHVYISLSEIQIIKEEDIAKNPVSKAESEIELTAAEILYQGMLPNLPQYMIALLKILLAAAPTSKAKTDSINIMADVLPEEMPMTVLQSMKLGIDVNRHKEILVKATSGVLLLLLKHFKINHIYQFEFMSQHLVFANCIPLVLKFFNQNIMSYVGAKNSIVVLDFPNCVIGEQPELTAESLEVGENQQFCWRNLFSCINLLRILNKLTKWKHSRTMMLVVFKSAPILKRALKVKQAMMQLYVLKLLKMQTKYLGRQWRKSNMKTMSAIYQKVRHRLNDDWAYGNDMDARPWDFQAEECALRACVDRFNNRRYDLSGSGQDPEFTPVDNNIVSVLGRKVELTEEFKRRYEIWLEREVFQATIDWDQLLAK